MKTRNGFVSNSSSSSFVVAFPHKPTSVEELQTVLFGNDEKYHSPYGDASWSAREITEIVYRSLESQSPSTLSAIADLAAEGYQLRQPLETTAAVDDFGEVEGMPELRDFEEGEETDWDAYEKACEKFGRKHAQDFIAKHPDAVFFEFEYSDNDGEMYTAMEHGSLFNRLPHMRVSHH